MSYIVVGGRNDEMMHRTVSRYLYEGQTIIGLPVKIEDMGMQYLIVDTGTNDVYRSNYVKDRLNSGPFGAVLFTSLPEAEAYIDGMK